MHVMQNIFIGNSSVFYIDQKLYRLHSKPVDSLRSIYMKTKPLELHRTADSIKLLSIQWERSENLRSRIEKKFLLTWTFQDNI